MSDTTRFALHRSELHESLLRGEHTIIELMKGCAFTRRADATLVTGGSEHDYVYRLIEGWVGRSRLLPDGRNQFILIFLPGDLSAVKSMFMMRHPDAIRCVSACVLPVFGFHESAGGRRSDRARCLTVCNAVDSEPVGRSLGCHDRACEPPQPIDGYGCSRCAGVER